MTMYCTCSICTSSPVKPNGDQGKAEVIEGDALEMRDNWMLVHWSKADFTRMLSTEIHYFKRLGHKFRVGSSFYLYRTQPPERMPGGFKQLGLGGRRRYTIGPDLARQMTVYLKGTSTANPAEVAVMLGCGGSITFDQNGTGTGYGPTPDIPRLTLAA